MRAFSKAPLFVLILDKSRVIFLKFATPICYDILKQLFVELKRLKLNQLQE